MIQFIVVWLVVFAIIFTSVQGKPDQPFEWVSDSTIQLIENFEGKRHRAYQDSQGNWTIGVGHLIRRETHHLLHTELSEEQVRGILHTDLKKCSDALESAVKVIVNRTQADALHSLCHNIGPDRMVRSEVIKHLNDGNIHKAGDAFLNWSNPSELRQRRKAERALFLAGH
jgi:lysozyme